MITRQLSNKIKIAGLLCTIMVVYRHSLNHEAFFGEWRGNSYSGIIEAGVSTLTEIAVPFFFLMSGFFFLHNSYYKKKEYADMARKKIRTLFVPFVIWNIIGIIPLWVAKQFEIKESFLGYSAALLHSDWYGALWYVRDLLTLMLFVPLYGWIFSVNSRWIYILVIFIAGYFWIPVDCKWLSTEGLFFFLLGGILQKYNCLVRYRLPLWIVILLTITWFLLSVICPYWIYIHKVNTVLGVVAFWQLLDLFSERVNRNILYLAKFSFFIYVTHLYIIKAMKVYLACYFGGNELVALLSYMFLPVITIAFSIVIGKLWSKFHPKSFSVVTGGRI